MKKQENKLPYSTIIIFAAFIFFVIYFLRIIIVSQLPSNSTKLLNTKEIKRYSSKNLQLDIEVPNDYRIEDTGITISLKNNLGEIEISRNGTNFSNLSDYLTVFDQRRKLIASKPISLTINSYEALTRKIHYPAEHLNFKSYYIYVNNVVYIFSTKSESLYNDLDKIAQSFRYAP